MNSVTIRTAAAAAIGIGLIGTASAAVAQPKSAAWAGPSASVPPFAPGAFEPTPADSTGSLPAPRPPALPSVGTGTSVTIWSEAATADDTVRLELRHSGEEGAVQDVPALMLRPELQDAVHAAVRSLRNRLGPGYRFTVEEVTEPSDADATPRLFLLVAVGMADETAQCLVDEFITDEWAQQPVGVRALVRVGSEFI